MARYFYIGSLILVSIILVSCQIATRGNERRGNYAQTPPTPTTPTVSTAPDVAPAPIIKPAPSANEITTAPSKRQLPRITAEPSIAVLLASGPEVTLTLPRGGTLMVGAAGGDSITVASGVFRAKATGKGLTTSATGARFLGDKIIIQVRPAAGAANFTVSVTSPHGQTQTLSLSGQPEIAIDKASRKAVLVERVGLEQYLRGVLPTEISPSWPLEAIKAQAVVARTYTLDRYLTRFDQPWQLHWHYTVDMAYGGIKTLSNRMAVALDQTRGQLLAAHGLPVPALFHACSGGRTESAQNFRPNLTGADNVTPMSDVMPVIDDAYAKNGAAALGMLNTHINWRVQIPMSTVSDNLEKWLAAHPEEHLRVENVSSVRVHERFRDSGRVATVMVRHRKDGREIETPINAVIFRLAVGPAQLRSTNWTKCVIANAQGGLLVIEGIGFGHGVGMSQVSAYQMAKEGKAAGDIMNYFYPGAKLVQWW
jgi:SpoIID/LytB domain protein